MSVVVYDTEEFHKESPIIDVVTVWYNRGYRVVESIGSIIEQDMSGFRVFAVNDGSTDDTAEQLAAMIPVARRHGVELVVWNKENEGFTRSLKRCIEERTTAPFIGLHGAGDISYPTRLSTLLALIQRDDSYAAAGCGVRTVGRDGAFRGNRQYDGVAQRDLIRGTIPKPATHECSIIRRSSYDAIDGYREFFQYAQDSDLWIRLSRIGRIVNTPEILFDKIEIAESVSADWRRSLTQRKYSTLAIQAGIAVDRGDDDPIVRLTEARRSSGSRNDNAWERAVDPRLLLQRFRFGKRIGAAVRDGHIDIAAGITAHLVGTWLRAIAWRLSGRR